ncbi:MAG: MFS transporter [Chloroflexota bacterium]|nr:MAG: MFS transporter [Chloroflexota bacterium]
MSLAFTRTRFTWLAYLLLAFYGFFLNILGPITPFLKDELALSYTVSSLHFTAFAAGILGIGFGGHLIIQKIGRLRSLWLGAAGMSLSALFLIAGRNPVLTISASFLMGLVGSLILAVVPSALSDQHGEQRAVALAEANVVASTVAASAPLMVGWFAGGGGGWRLALGVAALAPVLMWLIFSRAKVPESPASTHASSAALPPVYWFYWFAIVLVVSVEFCMTFWSADYFETVLGIPKVNAAQAVSLFLAGMILGRLAGSRLVERISARRLVVVSLLVASLGFLMYWQAGSAFLGLSGLFLTGLGVASLYPLILSLAIGSAGVNTAKAGSRATLASGAAILSLPLVLGRLADLAGIRLAYGVVALLLAGAFLIIQIAGRLAASQSSAAGRSIPASKR